jgi:hypothetical protein
MPEAPEAASLTTLRSLDNAGAFALLDDATRLAGASLEQLRPRSVHERAGRSVSRVYDATLRIGEDAQQTILVMHADARGYPAGALVLERSGVEVAVWRHPHDPYLPGLASATDPERVRDLLDELAVPPGAVRVRSRTYRPARRAVVEVHLDTDDASGRILYLKLVSGRRVEAIAEVHRDLAALLPVPRLVGTSPRQGILAMEALPGRTLRAVLVEGGALPSEEAILGISELLASSGVATRQDPRRFADPRRHVAALSALIPERVGEIARLADEAARVDGPATVVHGDLHDGQLLVDEDGRISGLLDVDGVGHGLLAHDAGALVAHVTAAGSGRPGAAARATAYADRLAAAYEERVGAQSLRRAVAGSWIGMATGPYRSQVSDWRARTSERLDRAVEALDGLFTG